MEKQIQRERALAEAEGRIKEQQENEDSNRCQAILQETKVMIQRVAKCATMWEGAHWPS